MDLLHRMFGQELQPEEKALEEAYNEIIGNLTVCPGHRPEGILSIPHSSIISLLYPQLMTRGHLIGLVREQLYQQLSESGDVDPYFRHKLVKLFCIKTAKKRSLDHVDLWAFFDSVLDASFEELETHVVFRGAEANSLLIRTIAKRSPYLKKLKLNFKFDSTQSSPQLMPMIQSLDSLHHLTSLTLYHLAGHFDDNPVLTFIGKSCPHLTHLRLAKSSPTSKHDILAIVLGELVDHLIGPHEFFDEQPYRRFKKVDWTEDAALSRLRVPSEFLTPVCFTLRHLELIECIDHHFYPAIAAFILRHMPLLEKLESCSGTEKAIHLLHNETEEAEENLRSIQGSFEQACRDAITLHSLALRNPREPEELPSSTFTSTLSLTQLEHVNIQDENIAGLLRSIGLTCPYLNDATFVEKKKEGGLRHCRLQHSDLVEKKDDDRLPFELTLDSDDRHQLELELSKWPKLESITFVEVSPEYIKSILNVFQEDLKELSFTGCKLINLVDLARCTQLQSLRISSTCSLNSYESVPELNADSFLPNLTSFSCKICLGAVSSVFEEKSTLKQLILKCCHKDIQESIELKWSSMEMLHLQRCSGLVNMSMVSHLIDQLVDLKELYLHQRLIFNDPKNLAREIIRKAYTKPTPIDIKFNFYENVRCLLDPMSDAAGNIPVPYRPRMRECVDSLPSGRSDESLAHSIYSTTDFDPDESYDELYFDSE